MADGGDSSQSIHSVYREILGRAPTPDEKAAAVEFLTDYRTELVILGTEAPEQAAVAAFVRVLMGSNEFLTID